MLSGRSSNIRRIGSARSANQHGWTKTTIRSVKNMFMSSTDQRKKNDDYSESWMPKKDFVIGKNGSTTKEGWLKFGLAAIVCCGLLGSVAGYLRSDSLVDTKYTGSVTSSSLLTLARDAKYDELHLALRTAINERCPDAVSALSKDSMFNFQSHMVDIVQHVSDGMSLTHVSDPAVDIHGGVFDRSVEQTKGYDCIIMNELVVLSHSPSHTHEDYAGEFSQSSESYEKTTGRALTGHADYDSKVLVSMATEGSMYELEMTVHKALNMHCDLTGMSEMAEFGLHSHVAELLEKVATHHAALRGMEFTPAIDLQDGTLVDAGFQHDKRRFRTCDLVSKLFEDALAPVSRGVETFFNELASQDYYHAELQADLLVNYHCPEARKQLSDTNFRAFREHLSTFAFYLADEKAIGEHQWGISRSGSIVVQSRDSVSCPLLNAMVEHHGDHKHDSEQDYQTVFNAESKAAQEEERYLKEHKNKQNVKHDAEFLRQLAVEHDHSGIEKYVPILLETHCSSIVRDSSQYALRNMHAHIAGSLYWLAAGEQPAVRNPKFDVHGEIVGDGAMGDACPLLTELFNLPATPRRQTQKVVEKSKPVERVVEKPVETSHYQRPEPISKSFVDQPLNDQVNTVMKEMQDNDWFDAETHIFDMMEQECDAALTHLANSNPGDGVETLMTIHSNVMGFISVLAVTDELPAGSPFIHSDGTVRFSAQKPSGAMECKVLDAFAAFGRSHLKDSTRRHIDVDAEMTRQKGHQSHADDVAHDVNLLIEDARSNQVIDLELDVENDLRTHCPNAVSKLRSHARRKLHAKVVQLAESVAHKMNRPIPHAIITSSGNIVGSTSAVSEKTFECSFVAELAARS